MNQSPNENLSVRIVTADYYTDKPIPEFGDQCYSAFRSLPVYHVPVIRIFGPTTKGVKTCIHVHGVFPYIFVPNWSSQLGEKDLYNFAVGLDKAINTSFARSNSKASHVHRITQVSGKSFYGYQEGERNFLKIEFYNPAIVKRAADLLLNAAVLNTVFQPHEAHIPYILQFFIDNNLYGMNNITFSSFQVRKNELQNDLNLNETVLHSDSNVPKISYSKLEVDVTVSDLCNVFSSGENVPNNPGLAFIWEEEKKRRRHNERPSQITPNQSQERPDKPLTRTELYFREKLKRKLQAIKDNQNVMDIENDEASATNSTYEELNSQSRGLLEILENLAGRRKNETDTPRSASSSPSLVYSDGENNVADISVISSQPLLKFSAEADSILGNDFSDEENDLDEHDHKALSQSMIYTRHENISSDDSDSDAGVIPQLDGAHDTDTSSKRKNKFTSRKGKQTKSSKESSKTSKENPCNSSSGRSYNLRSRGRNQEESKPIDKFKPKDFKIILNRLETKISPKKIYPRLNIDTQKSPRSSSSKSSGDANDTSNLKENPSSLPNLKNDAFVPALAKSPSVRPSKSVNTSNSASKNDKRLYPQLEISIRKSPKSTKPGLSDQRSIRGSAEAQGLKKRKINFEEENDTVKSNDVEDMNFVKNKWRKSLKRRKKDDTSFKIGESFSLLEFRKSKSNRQKGENYKNPAGEINSQGYSLCISDATSAGISARQEAKTDLNDEGSDMESLQVLDDNGPENCIISLSDCSTEAEKSKHRVQNSLAVPLDDIIKSDKPPVTLELNRDPPASPPIYENSLIELDVHKSNRETDSQIDLNIVHPLLDFSDDELKSEKSAPSATSQSIEDSANSFQNATLPAPEPVSATSADVKPKNANAPRKRNLGIRIRKNMKMASQSTRNVSNTQDTCPIVVCEDNNENLPSPPETCPDSLIDLDITKYYKDSVAQLSINENSIQLEINENYDSDTLPFRAENLIENASKFATESVKSADKSDVNSTTSPPYFEDSCIELDILKCTSRDMTNDEISEESKRAQENASRTPQPTCSSYEADKMMPNMSAARVGDSDCDFFDVSSQRLSNGGCQEEVATSNNQRTSATPRSLENADDSLLRALDALTPRATAALNKKLDSKPSSDLESRNSDASLVSESNPDDPLSPVLAEPNDSPIRTIEIDLPDSEPLSPSILDKTNYSICFDSQDASSDEDDSEKILFEDSPQRDTSEPRTRTKLESLLLNNSIWDSMDSDQSAEADNEIKSFYETCTPSHITIIREHSSPVAQPLTPQSTGSNEILSFYGSQSPDAVVCSISEDLKALSQESKSDPSIIECSQPKRPSRMSKCSSPLPHSAKKSPSPTYTPILKRLMIKKVAKDKRRVSSQRFQAEPFLPEIKEEEEKESSERDKNTSLSLPLECERSIIAKALDTSRSSAGSGASYQIDGATLENTCGFKMNLENLQDVKIDKQYQYITLISMELFALTRGDLKPDPEYDAVTCVFYSIHHDAPDYPNLFSGIIAVEDDKAFTLDVNKFKCEKIIVKSEAELYDKFLAVIRKWDPDMLIGYEVEMLSWGFFIQRGYFIGRNCSRELSRVIESKAGEPSDNIILEDDEYSNEIKLAGRIILNVWRLMRHEVNLQSYTFESILFHVQHQRVPYHTFKFLTECWKDALKRWIVIDYFLFRAESNIAILEQLDFICRTSELARLFGIQFYEVLSRGSQFRVESMMLRLAKTQNYVAVSPSVKQRFNMRAPECLPLIMEPESKFYTDPVIVLDFQSLYPSIVIAYNYCFSTCLGRIECLGQSEPFHFGCVEHVVPADLLVKLEPHLNLSPAGVAFVNKNIRKGVLPSMLEEILETRLMVKKSMKENKSNSILKRVLHARQLGLKLIANVTYGYTSANFSGRMPCMEVADSVVSKGRETLERAIEMVNNTKKWGARVVYGDTDSLFVLVPNRTKEEAFRIGSEIADAVTNDNPKPVKLKLEKVYLPCMLQTKKRYVGYMYESPDQEKPVYDAKGIETVRRDGCPAVSKILEKSLKLLFETRNITTVKQYVQRQFTKLISGRISIQELTFAREYRGMNNYKPAACVPALQLAKQALLKDRRSEPRVKERVPFVIVTGPPGVPLIRLVRTPQEFLDTPGALINTEYYITRAIVPALERCFILLNVNVLSWYAELPKKLKLNLPIDYEMLNKPFKKTTILHYFSSSKCLSCSKAAGSSVCQQCVHRPQRVALVLGNMINEWQRKHNNVSKICRSCCARTGPIQCTSLDCPIYYLYRQTERDAGQVRYVEDLRREYLYF